MSIIANTTSNRAIRAGMTGALRQGAVAFAVMWTRQARTRRHLKHLDAHLLRDIGLSDFEARREATRRFWD